MLVARALPVILRKAGVSLDQIGVVYLVLFPWALKFLWAPLVDRANFAGLGRYRSSLLVLHSALVVGVVALSCVDFTHFLLQRSRRSRCSPSYPQRRILLRTVWPSTCLASVNAGRATASRLLE